MSREQPVVQVPEILGQNPSASIISMQWQHVARQMLQSPGLIEASENVYSTCAEPLESFGDRLIWARDTATPLVEVSKPTLVAEADRLREMLGIEGNIASDLMTTTGKESLDRDRVSSIAFEKLSYVTWASHKAGRFGGRLQSVLSLGKYSGYNPTEKNFLGRPAQPRCAVSYAYEAGTDFTVGAQSEMNQLLITATHLFAVATSQHGTAANEPSVRT